MINPQRIVSEFKAQGEKLDFGWDWSKWLTARGLTIASAVAAVTSGTATLEGATGASATANWFRISAGATGTVEVTSTITASDGQIVQGLHRVVIG